MNKKMLNKNATWWLTLPRGPCFEQTWLKLLYLKMLPTSFSFYGQMVFVKVFYKIVIRVSIILYYLSLREGVVLKLVLFKNNNLERPLLQDAFWWIWLKLVQWFWRRQKCKKFTGGRTKKQTDGRSPDKKW